MSEPAFPLRSQCLMVSIMLTCGVPQTHFTFSVYSNQEAQVHKTQPLRWLNEFNCLLDVSFINKKCIFKLSRATVCVCVFRYICTFSWQGLHSGLAKCLSCSIPASVHRKTACMYITIHPFPLFLSPSLHRVVFLWGTQRPRLELRVLWDFHYLDINRTWAKPAHKYLALQ